MFSKNTFLLFGLAMMVSNLFSQISFSRTTLYKSAFSTEQDVYSHSWISNIGSINDTIVWTRTMNSLPDTAWTSAVCDINQCHPVTTTTAEFVLNSGDSGYLSFHFYPKNKRGTGNMTVEFYRKANPSEKYNIVYKADVWGATSISVNNVSKTSVFPNPSAGNFTIKNSIIALGTIKIFNNMGQVVFTGSYANNETFDNSFLTSGIYTVVISDNKNSETINMVKE